MSHAATHARNLVVMVTAGLSIEDAVEMARGFGVRAVHVQQLAVPVDERSAQTNLTQALKLQKQ